MSMMKRQIGWGISIALFVLLCLGVSFMLAFPFIRFEDLLNGSFMDIPLIVFIPAITVLIGLGFGIYLGVYWRRNLQSIEHLLGEVERGKTELSVNNTITEVNGIVHKIKSIQKQMTEQ